MKTILTFIAAASLILSAPIMACDTTCDNITATSVLGVIIIAEGTPGIVSLALAGASAGVSKLSVNATQRKEFIQQLQNDVQEYNIGGQISPLLLESLHSIQNSNSNLSIDEIFDAIQNLN